MDEWIGACQCEKRTKADARKNQPTESCTEMRGAGAAKAKIPTSNARVCGKNQITKHKTKLDHDWDEIGPPLYGQEAS